MKNFILIQFFFFNFLIIEENQYFQFSCLENLKVKMLIVVKEMGILDLSMLQSKFFILYIRMGILKKILMLICKT